MWLPVFALTFCDSSGRRVDAARGELHGAIEHYQYMKKERSRVFLRVRPYRTC